MQPNPQKTYGMKTRQSPRRGNMGSALSSYSDEQKIKPEGEDDRSSPTPPPPVTKQNHPGQPTTSQAETSEKPISMVSDTDTTTGGGRSGSIDFRGRSDTMGSLGGPFALEHDFRGRSETLGSAADVLADCLGPFPSVLDVNVQALPPDQRQVYSVNQAQQQQQPTSQALPVPRGGGGSNPGSQPSSQGSASGFLSQNFGNATNRKATAGSSQKIPAGGIAHTPPSALGPASYEVKHFGKRMRAGVSYFLLFLLCLSHLIFG